MHSSTSRPPGNWRRRTVRAVIVGTTAAMVVASAASAFPPYDPDDHQPSETYNTGGAGSSTSDGWQIGSSSTACLDGADGHVQTDWVKLTDPRIDFGDSNWVSLFRDPAGTGSVSWDVVCGFYTPRLVGTLHLNDAAGYWGRMHISFWSYGDNIETRHSNTARAAGNGSHLQFAVDLSPTIDVHITEVHVCTELSDNNIDFDQVDCQTEILE
jgi:hypothetical protein